MPDGTEHVVMTLNHVARASSGAVYNERRQLVPTTFAGEPRLTLGLIYDPSSRLSITLEPNSRIARETTLTHAPADDTRPRLRWGQWCREPSRPTWGSRR